MLYEFENLALSTNPDKKITTELADIMEVINESTLLNKKEIKNEFWNIFIIDSLIGNTDRHNGNWGFLLNPFSKQITLAPIFDCGSCLNPLLEDDEIKKLTKEEVRNLAVNTYSCLKENTKKINCISYIKSLKNADCKEALLRIFPKIDIDKIKKFIDNIECMSVVRKEFYKEILDIRYNILKQIYNKLRLTK